MQLGYVRVFSDDQNLASQRAALRKAGCRRLYEEKVSGTSRDRPELIRLLDALREKDVVVVTRLDRLARSTRDLLNVAGQIKAAGAGLRSLAEPWADTTSSAGHTVLTVFAGLVGFERSLFQTRTSAGRSAAAEHGVRFGRPPKLGPDQLALARRLVEEGTPVREVAKLLKVHMATLYRVLDVPLLSGMSAPHSARSGAAPQPQPKS